VELNADWGRTAFFQKLAKCNQKAGEKKTPVKLPFKK
jgi:hypothetical protein